MHGYTEAELADLTDLARSGTGPVTLQDDFLGRVALGLTDMGNIGCFREGEEKAIGSGDTAEEALQDARSHRRP